MGTVGGGLSTFVPNTKKETHMADDYRKEIDSLKAAMDEMKCSMQSYFGTADKEEDKEEMAADDMLSEQFGEDLEEGEEGIHIDIGSHDDEEEMEEEGDKEMFPASRRGAADTFALRRENSKMARELHAIKSELSKERFSRELDLMEQDGYTIPSKMRPRLLAELSRATDPASTIEGWRELFAQNPMGVRIDMSRASMPQGDLDARQVSDLVREFAGKPEEFRKAVNSRINKR
jgi:hypothetical protein